AWNLLYALAPAGEGALYIGLSNTVLALPSFAPIVVGSIAMLLGYTNLFWLAAALAGVTFALPFRFAALRELAQRALVGGTGAESATSENAAESATSKNAAESATSEGAAESATSEDGEERDS